MALTDTSAAFGVSLLCIYHSLYRSLCFQELLYVCASRTMTELASTSPAFMRDSDALAHWHLLSCLSGQVNLKRIFHRISFTAARRCQWLVWIECWYGASVTYPLVGLEGMDVLVEPYRKLSRQDLPISKTSEYSLSIPAANMLFSELYRAS